MKPGTDFPLTLWLTIGHASLLWVVAVLIVVAKEASNAFTVPRHFGYVLHPQNFFPWFAPAVPDAGPSPRYASFSHNEIGVDFLVSP